MTAVSMTAETTVVVRPPLVLGVTVPLTVLEMTPAAPALPVAPQQSLPAISAMPAAVTTPAVAALLNVGPQLRRRPAMLASLLQPLPPVQVLATCLPCLATCPPCPPCPPTCPPCLPHPIPCRPAAQRKCLRWWTCCTPVMLGWRL